MSLSFTVSETVSLISKNLKTSRDCDHLCLRLAIQKLYINRYMENQCTKFDSSSFSHSCATDEGLQNLKRVTWRFVVHRLQGLAMINLCTKFEASAFTHYKEMQKATKNVENEMVLELGSPKVIGNIAIWKSAYEVTIRL